MLKRLMIKNLVLVEEAVLTFGDGLTVITGETGAGKTALIEAIRLLLGERADASRLRKGADKARVEGAFDLPSHAGFFQILNEAGIEVNPEEELILSRELSSAGKGRAFLSSQMVPAALLQKLAPYLVDFIGQSAALELKQTEKQRILLDTYLELDLTPFQHHFKMLRKLTDTLKTLEKQKADAQRRIHMLEAQLEELQEAGVQEGEEETLFEEYGILANAQEILENAGGAQAALDVALIKTAELRPSLEKLSPHNKSIHENLSLAGDAHLQLLELQQLLQSFVSKVESNPSRLAFLEERLKRIDRLKKKYGDNLFAFQKQCEKELQDLDGIDDGMERTRQELEEAQEKTAMEALALTEKRRQGADQLQAALTATLRGLNIPSAEVFIEIQQAPRTLMGEDAVEFSLKANEGEKPSLIRAGTSGGELSRLLFALKLALAKQSKPRTMVFDEIDANVGGETATIIGAKLKELGRSRQLLCITHFPQVARQADTHVAVSKEESGGRTWTNMKPLDAQSKEIELLRMLGGEKALR